MITTRRWYIWACLFWAICGFVFVMNRFGAYELDSRGWWPEPSVGQLATNLTTKIETLEKILGQANEQIAQLKDNEKQKGVESRVAELEDSQMTVQKVVDSIDRELVLSKDDLIHNAFRRIWLQQEGAFRENVEREKKERREKLKKLKQEGKQPKVPDLSPRGSDIVLVTGYTSNIKEKYPVLIEQMAQNRQEYADRHKYTNMIVDLDKDKEKLDKGVKLHWLKLYAIQHAFDEHPEAKWVFWLDYDAIIMNMDIDLATHVLHPDSLKEKIMYDLPMTNIGKRFKGLTFRGKNKVKVENIELILCHDPITLNTGGMFLKRTDFIRNKTMDMWMTEDYMHTNYEFPEQDPLADLLQKNEELYNKMAIVSVTVFNSYYESYGIDSSRYKPGDWICHFPGQKGSLNDNWQVMWNRLNTSSLEYA